MTAQRGKELVRRLVEIVNAGDLSALPEVASGEILEAAEGWIGPFRASFPDFQMEVVDVIAEGDKVVGHFKCSGTHEGEWRGVPATGRRFEEVDEIYIFRVEGDRLSSATAVVEDNLTRLRQLGLEPEAICWAERAAEPGRGWSGRRASRTRSVLHPERQ